VSSFVGNRDELFPYKETHSCGLSPVFLLNCSVI
jgi:hypothetical protein